MFRAKLAASAHLGLARLEQEASQLPALANVAVGAADPLLVAWHARIADDPLQDEEVVEEDSDFADALVPIVLRYFALQLAFVLQFVSQYPVLLEGRAEQLSRGELVLRLTQDCVVHPQLPPDVGLELLAFGDDGRMAQVDGKERLRSLDCLDDLGNLLASSEQPGEVEMQQSLVPPDELLEAGDVLVPVEGEHCDVQVLQLSILGEGLKEQASLTG